MTQKVEPAQEKMLSALSTYRPPNQNRLSTFEPEAQEVIQGLQVEVQRLRLESDRQLGELERLREEVKLARASSSNSMEPQQILDGLKEIQEKIDAWDKPAEQPQFRLSDHLDQYTKAIHILAEEVAKLKRGTRQSTNLPPLPEWNEAWFSSVKEQWLKIYAALITR